MRDFDAVGAILIFGAIGCLIIAGCSALGIALIEITFRP